MRYFDFDFYILNLSQAIMVEVKRKERESIGSLLRRFQKVVQYAAVVTQARSHRFFESRPTRRARRRSALRRIERSREFERLKKLGKLKEEKRPARPRF